MGKEYGIKAENVKEMLVKFKEIDTESIKSDDKGVVIMDGKN